MMAVAVQGAPKVNCNYYSNHLLTVTLGRFRLSSSAVAMVYSDSDASSTRPTGGEYGDVHASIDNDKLNTYLASSVPALTVPVTIKQFKVRPFDCLCYRQGQL